MSEKDNDYMQRLLHEIHDCPAYLYKEVDYFTVNWDFWKGLVEQFNDTNGLFMETKEVPVTRERIIVLSGCDIHLNEKQKQPFTTYLK